MRMGVLRWIGVTSLCFALLASRNLAVGQDQSPTPSEISIESFIQILDQLQADPAARENVRKTVQERIDAIKSANNDQVQKTQQALADAKQRAVALKQRVDELAAQIEAARSEYAELEKQIPELTSKLEAAKAQGDQNTASLPVLERTLSLLDALTPTSTPPAEPAVTPAPAPVQTATLTDEQKLFFEKNVHAVLAENCFGCHGPETQKSGMRLDSLDGMLKGGKRGPVLKPGDAGGSLLIQAIAQTGELKMPPDKTLDAATIQNLVKWVEIGAPWPGNTPAPQSAAVTPEPPAPAEPQAAAEPAPESPDPHAEVVPAASTSGKVNFVKDVRPILVNYCFACHGPDDATRKAGLRLDTEESALAALKSGRHPIVPGDKSKSEVFARITTNDADDIMPPADFGKTLTPAQIEIIGRWIDSGGKYEAHWAFVTPKMPAVPAVADASFVRNPIDSFIVSRLEQDGLKPSPEADRRTLIRRVSYDLTGLPPTLEEVRAFVNDQSPDAYEKMIERYLASPHYGEHMARYWLDLARYADTNGYHIDNERYMWRWREWVIDAYNRNMPFDQFTVEQIAGDLLPNPSLNQIIATGFNRNHMITFEGGVIPEEYRVQYVNDRVITTSTVWMGLTMGCAQCHDHKFEPFTMRDFYAMSAFFSSIPEEGIDGRDGNSKPLVKAPLPEQASRLAELEQRIAAVTAEMHRPLEAVDAAQAKWEGDYLASLATRWSVLVPEQTTSAGGATLTPRDDGALLVSGENPEKDTFEIVATTKMEGITAIRLEALTDPSLPNGGASRADDSNFYLSEVEAEIAPLNQPDLVQKVTFVLANADHAQADATALHAIDGNPETAWAVEGNNRRENRIAVFMPERPIGFADGTRIKIKLRHESKHKQRVIGCFRLSVTNAPDMAPGTYGPWYVSGPYVASDGKVAYETVYAPEKNVDLSAVDENQRLLWLPRYDLTDGVEQKLIGDVAATYLYRTITVPNERDATFGVGSNDSVKVWVNGEVVLDEGLPRSFEIDKDRIQVRLKAGENTILMKVVNYGNAYAYSFRRIEELVGDIPLDIEPILAIPVEKRNEQQIAKVRSFYRNKHWDEWAPLATQLASLNADKAKLDSEIPTTMVMQELEKPRDTFILVRGQYDQPGEKVVAATPASLPQFPASEHPNRLGFAKWLVHPSHPLTSRVAVNRIWQKHFGVGLVKTTEDFGIQGELPSHPELLDWLAVEFMNSGWDVKKMHRLILTSATYRQSSRVTPELLEHDPENRLLARAPRFRMDAEAVRDTALAVSGLLVRQIGGPSVKPYQPKGIWEEVSYGGKDFTGQVFEQDHGEKLYRRSLYTFWKRQAPPPSMLLFDAPNREVCTARRARTNTPLQALVTMNDVQFVEASRFLAERIMKEGGGDPAARVAYGFELATCRPAEQAEIDIILDVFNKQLADYRANPQAATDLLTVGEAKRDESLDAAEHAAWTMVANLLLNLDEVLAKT